MSNPRPFVSKPEMLEMVNLTYPTVWKLIHDGQFPRGVVIGGRTFWYLDEVQGWLEDQPRQSWAGPNRYEISAAVKSGKAAAKARREAATAEG